MSVMSSEIDRVARTCVVIECNGMSILLMSGYAAACSGEQDDWVKGLCNSNHANVAASPGECFAHPGRHKGAAQVDP